VSVVDTTTPVVVVNGQLAGLAIMRSLGPLGVPLYAVDGDRGDRLARARTFSVRRRRRDHAGPLTRADNRPTRHLIPTSDETTQFVAEHRDELREHFIFQDNSPELVTQLASKQEMFGLAVRHGVPTPHTIFPTCLQDVERHAETSRFPVMLKGIYGNRLQLRTNRKMVIVQSAEELFEAYRAMEDISVRSDAAGVIQAASDLHLQVLDRQSDCVVGLQLRFGG
jgi:predicted ATP-grasp superfamily ATP-dependent carboligase